MLSACGGDDKDQSVAPPAAKDLELNILHINDHHSQLDEQSIKFKMDIGAGAEEFKVSNAGFARVAGLMNQISKDKPNTFKMHGGDAMTGDLYYNLTAGKADADVMNTVCFDSFTPGNHEFDDKDAGLNKFLGFLDQGNCKVKTQVLSANINFGPSSPLYKNTRIQKSHIFEKDGQKFAVIGLTAALKTQNSSQPNADTVFSDELETAQKEINALKAKGVNKIILQTHIGYSLDKKLAQELTDVDVIVGGDSHTLLGPQTLSKYGITPEGEYPTQLKNKDGDKVCVVQAWQYSNVVGELNVKFDKDGKVSSCTGTPHMIIGDNFTRTAANAAAVTATEKTSIFAQFKKDQAPFTLAIQDPKTLEIMKPYQAMKEKFTKEIVGQAPENLCLRRVPGTQRDVNRSVLGDVCNKNPLVNQHGGDIQQMIAEAFLQQGKAFFDADVSFQNGGGVRVDVAQGDVTVEKIYQVLPFNNVLVRLDMTGAEIKATLEDAMNAVVTQDNSTGSYPYTGGLRWNVDLNQDRGQRLTKLEVRMSNGQYAPLDLTKTYRVITIDFLANGGDYYTTMKGVTGERREDVGLVYAEAFLKYAQSLAGATGQKQLQKLPIADYSTQLFIDKLK
ncbi:5'-nucleotidase [Acinetobacter calcoaceticus]|uniref:5'-nucleotidase n=1 Tax=Acinetobacter calcoaceticus TaxID=471 RepID=A0A4R1XDF6_ACICA|nr:5'-nucleotidase [Acinetobacter calcoaceticus]